MGKGSSLKRKLTLILLLAGGTVFLAQAESLAETSEELIEQKKQVDERIVQLNAEAEALKKQLEVEVAAYNRTRLQIERSSREIKELHQKIKQRKEVLEGRLKAYQIHESNLNIYVEAIFGSANLVEVMSRVTSVGTMIEADRALYDEYKNEQLALGEKRVALNELNMEQEERYRKMQVNEADLEVLLAEVHFMSLKLQEEIAEAQERERLEAERRAAERELASLRMLQGPLDATGVDSPPAQPANIAAGVELAKTYVGMPYMWAGMHPSTSFDCSGLIYWSYRQKGITVPRTSRQQYAATVRVKKEDVLPGDLVFFQYDGRIGHVGIYIGDGLMLNSQNAGVVIEAVAGWQKHFAGYGRVVN